MHTCRQLFVSVMAFALKVNDRFIPNRTREIATMRMYTGELSPRTKDISCVPSGSGRVFGSTDTLLHTTGLQPPQGAGKNSPSAPHRASKLVLLCESPSVVWPRSQRYSTASENIPQFTGTQGLFSGDNVPEDLVIVQRLHFRMLDVMSVKHSNV